MAALEAWKCLGFYPANTDTSVKPHDGARGVSCDQKLLALKLELARVKKEREFLRDAAAFFAKESS